MPFSRDHYLLVVGCPWLDEDQFFRRPVDLSFPLAAVAVGLPDCLISSAAAAEAVLIFAAVESSACAFGAFDLSEGGFALAGGADDSPVDLYGLNGKACTLCTPLLAYEWVICISMLISNFLKLAAFLCWTTVSSSSSSSSCSSISSYSSHGVCLCEEL
jgi:hypothetical protein